VYEDVGMRAVTALATDRKGRIDVAGVERNAFAVARFHAGGGLDHSFGRKGKATAKLADDLNGPGVPYSMALDSKRRIVVGGTNGTSRPDFGGRAGAFARFTPKGKVNRRFGHRGTVTLDRRLRVVNSIAIDARNRIVAAGNVVVRLLG
jgi:hypothetical protein